MCETDRSGLRPPSAHGPRAQTEERRNRRRDRDTYRRREEKEREGGVLVSSCSSRSDNDGALLPCNATGKFTSQVEPLSINNRVHMLIIARSEQGKTREIINDFFFFISLVWLDENKSLVCCLWYGLFGCAVSWLR